MKVICIDDSSIPPHSINAVSTSGWYPYEGEIYTVLESCFGKCYDGSIIEVYSLVEDPKRDTYGYEKWRFIPLSNISETEFERNYQKEKV